MAKKKAKKKKAVKKVAAKAAAEAKPVKERKHPDMVTIAMRGEKAKPILAFMAEHSLKGAALLRKAFAFYAAAVEAGDVDPEDNGEGED